MKTNTKESALTHTSYKAAIAHVEKTKGFARWDGGAGWIAEARYCKRLRRVIQSTISPDGIRVHSS